MPLSKKSQYHHVAIRHKREFATRPWASKTIAKGILIVMGKLKGEATKDDPMVVQGYRFNKSMFNPATALAWLKERKIKPIVFEAVPGASFAGVTKTRLQGATLTSGGCEYRCYVGKRKRVFCGKKDKKCKPA